MIRLKWRPWLVLFLLLSASSYLAGAANPPVITSVDSQHGDSTPSSNHDLQAEHKKPAAGAPGSPQFHQAHSLLRKLRPLGRRSTQLNKHSGFLGAIWHYTKSLFSFLFMNGAPRRGASVWTSMKLGDDLVTAVRLLEESAAQGNADAVFTLAEINFYGKYTWPRNLTYAYERYHQLASELGNSTAQHMVGFFHATGVGNVVEKDQAKALLYHTFAADAGNSKAQMTVAYRHNAGVACPRHCEKAVHYYKKVADKAMAFTRSGPPGGRQMTKDAYRLADEEGGIYGEGASVSSSGVFANHNGASDTNDDVMEFLDLMSRKGELKATFGLGKMHYEGSRALRQDFRIARDYFKDVARRYWTKDGKIKLDTEPGIEKLASKAAGYLGRMFLRGEGVEQNFAKARTWFWRGIQNGDALCQHSMGLMHLQGLGISQDPVKAAEYFGAAADQDMAAAQVRLGSLLMDQGDLQSAAKYFDLAARHGHIEAFYYLAELSNLGAGRDRSCSHAALYYKIAVEKAEPIHSHFREANEAYEDGDIETALLLYMMAAEQGYEAGQANVAFLLDRQHTQSPLRSLRFHPMVRILFPSNVGKLLYGPVQSIKSASLFRDAYSSLSLALIYWTRSAKQSNIDSLVKMGDYYLSGHGVLTPVHPTPDNQLHPDPEKAAACYSAAAETLQSAQAMYNLGWMHENGIGGVQQDFHLAKRWYDQSAETNVEAWLPVGLALAKLRVRSWWNWVSGGDVHGIETDTKRRPYSPSEWLSTFLQEGLDAENAQDRRQQQQQQQRDVGDAESGPDAGNDAPHADAAADANDGMAWQYDIGDYYADPFDYQRYRGSGSDGEGNSAAAAPGDTGRGDRGDDTRIRGKVSGRRFDSDDDDDDEYDEYDEWDDEGLVDMFIILGLAAALAGLIYYRQMRAGPDGPLPLPPPPLVVPAHQQQQQQQPPAMPQAPAPGAPGQAQDAQARPQQDPDPNLRDARLPNNVEWLGPGGVGH